MSDLEVNGVAEVASPVMKRWTIEVTTEDGPRTLIIYSTSEGEARGRVPAEIARSTGRALSATVAVTSVVSVTCSGFV